MQHRDPSPPPGDRARRRSLFGGRPETTPPPATAGLSPSAAERTELVITTYQEMIQEQLDEGLRSIQHAANALMHEIAGEVWRSAGGDKEAVGSRILQELSRDQAIRALIAHSDERFQALAARTGRVEDTMNMLAESVRAAREEIARGADALAESGGGGGASSLGTGQIRAQLDEVSRQVAAAFQTLADRDQEIVDTLHLRIREHGELVVQETARISQAMQEYVQQGVEAMSHLAGSADSSMQAMSAHDDGTEDRVRSVDQQISELAEQLQLLYDRTGIAMSSLHESVTFLGDRMGVEARERLEDMNRAFEARVIGLANLVRSDSEALRRELVSTAEAHDETIARLLDERLHQVTETLGDSVAQSMQIKLDDSLAALAARTDEQTRLIDARTGETLSAIDRNLIRMVDALDEHFERLGTGVGERAATAAELAIGARFDDVLARLHAAASVIERDGSVTRDAIEATRSHLDETRSALDTRFVALAKLVRSDSETLSGQIVADQEVTKQALRAMKELQASLPSEVIQMVEERFGSLAESIERSNEMLAARIDRMADTIGQRQNDDIQVVIDRMGDAMHALASLGKEPGTRGSGPRIEID
jgi:ABC-type transporter Mla subunit MlaD